MVIKDYVTILVSSMLVRGGRGNGLRTQEMMDQVLAPKMAPQPAGTQHTFQAEHQVLY